MLLLPAAIERLYELNVGVTGVAVGRHERPHKPLLLLAALDLIDEGLATPDQIPWCQPLCDRFTQRFEIVRKHDDQNNPDLPFRYLASDGFWLPLEADGSTKIRRQLNLADLDQVFARFTGGFEPLVAIPANRQLMREVLISRYFPKWSRFRTSVTQQVQYMGNTLAEWARRKERPPCHGKRPEQWTNEPNSQCDR